LDKKQKEKAKDMKKIFSNIWQVIEMIALIVAGFFVELLSLWPVLAIVLIIVFLVAFLSKTVAIVLASILGFLFIVKYIVDVISSKTW
jgi:ABC-type proline/glycine betaine transport system permease subunit